MNPKRLAALAVLAIGFICSYAQGEYCLTSNNFPKINDTITAVKGIAMTFCYKGSETSWSDKTSNSKDEDGLWKDTQWEKFEYHLAGQKTQSKQYGKDSIPTQGAYLQFEPTQSGTLLVMLYVGKEVKSKGKIKVVEKDDSKTKMLASKLLKPDGTTYEDHDQGDSACMVMVDLEANKTYIIYDKDASTDLFGFAFGYPMVFTAPSGYVTWSDSVAREVPTGMKLYTVKLEENNTKAVPTQKTDTVIPASTGVMMKGKASSYYAMKPGETSATFTDNGLTANVEESSQESGHSYYVLACDKDAKSYFALYDSSLKLTAHKAYFKVASSGTTARVIRIAADEAPTGIATLREARRDDGACFNLHGQRIGKPQKGIYIQNGKIHATR